ncbi:hypothetical protein [Streptomyces sp. NPDC001568]|uniref:hypothetical protein n=1 Tax=Streptomyces sp. NPDC001568 TaxID=3364588 RepID=UPI00368B34C1
MGVLLLFSVLTAAGMAVFGVAMNHPSPTAFRFCAVLPLVLAPSAGAVYCGGLLFVRFGGPFPERCEDRSGAGAELTTVRHAKWPLSDACVYSDGSIVEHVPTAINVLVSVLAGLALVLIAAATVLRRRTRKAADETVVGLSGTGDERVSRAPG